MNLSEMTTNELVRLYVYSKEINDPMLDTFFLEVEDELMFREFDLSDKDVWDLLDYNETINNGELDYIQMSIPQEVVFQ